VVILTFDGRDTTLRCLRTVASQEGPEFDVLLWDNGSTDGTVEAVRDEFPDVVTHSHPSNLGVAGGRNAAAGLAVEEFEPDYLLFLDNDLQLRQGFIQAMREPFDEDQGLAQTQAKLLFAHDPRRLNDGGGCRIQYWLGRTQPVGYGETDRGQYDRRTRCVAGGGAMMIRTDVFRSLAGFDETFSPTGPEDLDLSLRARQAGYHALYVPEAVAYHTPSHTRPAGYSPSLRVRHWWEFCRRHAGPIQRLGFLLVGAPLMYSRTRIGLSLRVMRGPQESRGDARSE
jgi:GT2 family glycosyltransferase